MSRLVMCALYVLLVCAVKLMKRFSTFAAVVFSSFAVRFLRNHIKLGKNVIYCAVFTQYGKHKGEYCYLTDAIDAHISALATFVARCPISDGIPHFFREVFVQWTAVQLTRTD